MNISFDESEQRDPKVSEILSAYKKIHEIDTQDPAQLNTSRQKIKGLIKEFFLSELRESKGKVTQEILEYADRLFLDGIASTVAESINLSLYDLSLRLGKEVEATCAGCGEKFRLFRRRTIKGFQGIFGEKCSECSARLQKMRSSNREDEYSKWAKTFALEKQFLLEEDSLKLPEVQDRIIEHALYWESGMIDFKNEWGFSRYEVINGCMICNNPRYRIMITRDKNFTPNLERLIDQWSYLYTDHVVQLNLRIPKVLHPFQVLIRIPPYEFFSNIIPYPLKDLPLILVCDDCSVCFEKTHYHPYPKKRFGS